MGSRHIWLWFINYRKNYQKKYKTLVTAVSWEQKEEFILKDKMYGGAAAAY